MARSFQAVFFDGLCSDAQSVTVHLDGSRLRCVTADGTEVVEVALGLCTIEPALGHTPRLIRMPGGGQLETGDHPAVRELERQRRANRGLRLVHGLESRWPAVLAALLLLAAFTWGMAQYGLPALAERVARQIPASVFTPVIDQTLKRMDGQMLKPSGLPAARQAELRQRFAALRQRLIPQFDARLLLRDCPAIGANALAFPDGRILVTDQLVKRVETDDRVLAVIAHEMGHLHYHHGTRSLVQRAGVALLLAGLAGDFSSIASLSAGLPALLLHNGYSRQFEREADRFAADYLLASGQGTKPMQEALTLLTEAHPGEEAPAYLSTHPATAERIRQLQQLQP